MKRLFPHYKPSLPKDAVTFPSVPPHGARSVRASPLVASRESVRLSVPYLLRAALYP